MGITEYNSYDGRNSHCTHYINHTTEKVGYTLHMPTTLYAIHAQKLKHMNNE